MRQEDVHYAQSSSIIYKTVIRLVPKYGSETCAARKAEQNLLERTEMGMLRWIMMGVDMIEKIKNEGIRARTAIANISHNIREARLIWLGHVERKTEDNVVVRTWKIKVGGHRNLRRPKLK